MWRTAYWGPPRGEARRALMETRDRVIAVGRHRNDLWVVSKALTAAAIYDLIWIGPGAALKGCRELFDLSRETQDPRPKCMGLWVMAVAKSITGAYEEAIEDADEALRVSLCPVDRYAAAAAKSIGYAFSGRAREGRAMLEETVASWQRGGLHMNRMDVEAGLGTAMVLTGDMAAGVRHVEEASRRFEALGQPFARAVGDLFLGRIYAEIAFGGDRPPVPVIFRNLLFFLTTVPVAARKARRCLESALHEYRDLDVPYGVAASLFELARLDAVANRGDAARARLEEARPIAESVAATSLVDQIDAALATL